MLSQTPTPLFCALALASLFLTAAADFGPCRYDPDLCSCKMGIASQGICWDRLPTDPNTCKRRFCLPGWTCACGGRTHVCTRRTAVVHTLKNAADKDKPLAPCGPKRVGLVSGRTLLLGSVRIHISRRGLRGDDCGQIAWWHNGELLGYRKEIAEMTDAKVDAELYQREDHSKLELRPGDLVAFRFREASYYCYNHLTELVVNGTAISTLSEGVTTHFARAYSENWFTPSYKLTSRNIATDEITADPKKFVVARERKLSNNEAILPGEDTWEPRNDGNRDNRRSNWYFRIQIPNPLPKER